MNAVWTDNARSDIDIGDEAPLVTADNRAGPPDRRRVSMRWLAGTVLAALASTSLMGGALFVAFDGRPSIARPVGALFDPAARTADGSDARLMKGDLFAGTPVAAPTRQVLKVSTITRDGERDLVRVRPFARITAPLVTDTDAVAAEIPAFNPLRVFADANTDTGPALEDTLYGAAVDGQMAMRVTDFPVADRSLEPVVSLDVAATEAVVREAAQFLDGTNVQLAALPLIDPGRFDFGFAERGSFEQYGVRIIPENVSFVATTGLSDEGTASSSYTEIKTVEVTKGDTLEQILVSNEATDEEAAEIHIQSRVNFGLTDVDPGDRVRIELASAGDDTGRYRPIRVSIYRAGNHVGTLALSDHQGYVVSEEPRPVEGDDLFAAAAEAEVASGDAKRPRLYESLYQTALSNDMSPALIDEMMRVFSFDMDFNTRVSPGDALEVVYSLDDNELESEEATDIVYAALTLDGTTRRYYRFKAPDDGSVDYYDQEGRSAKKFLMRKPMSSGTFRSGFGSRRHPLLGYVRAHTGVDWSAPRGTPIMAAGDGEVIYADWRSGYGNFIEIRHTNGYVTKYAHQSGFAKGIKKGVRVRQGQVVGYVGSTGLSTGPHLHYEVHVNGNPVDPMRIKLPRGRSLEGDMLARFEGERERIDTLLGGGQTSSKVAAVPTTGG